MIAITDGNGDVVANYSYDAWGVCTVISDTTDCNIATINPYRYRGYYFDPEIGLYYVSSRYYDPVIGRFINADEASYCNIGGFVLNKNLYIYCNNNSVNMIDELGYQPKWAGAISRAAKNTSIYKSFVYATQKGMFRDLFYAAGFTRDSRGVYHARQNCWQRIAGYNDLYDWAFNLGTSMRKAKFPFTYNRKSYIFWAWKGDYLNLGAGAELGIYYGGGWHWYVDQKLALPMSLTLKWKGRTIIQYNPGKVWWLTGFNPYYQNVNASQLKATYSINFSSKRGMFTEVYRRYRWTGGWSFNSKKYTATYTF